MYILSILWFLANHLAYLPIRNITYWSHDNTFFFFLPCLISHLEKSSIFSGGFTDKEKDRKKRKNKERNYETECVDDITKKDGWKIEYLKVENIAESLPYLKVYFINCTIAFLMCCLSYSEGFFKHYPYVYLLTASCTVTNLSYL